MTMNLGNASRRACIIPLLQRTNLLSVNRKRIEKSHKLRQLCLELYSTSMNQGRFVIMPVQKGGRVDMDYITRFGGWSIRAPRLSREGGIHCCITGLRRCAPPHQEWQTPHPPMGRHDNTLDLKRVRRYQLHLPIPITQHSPASTQLTSLTRVTSTEVPGTNSPRSSLHLFNAQDRRAKLYVG